MPSAVPFKAGDGLLVVDVFNDFAHQDGDRLLASFRARLPAMVRALAAARAERIPVIYVNDDANRWDSDAPGLVSAVAERGEAKEMMQKLSPVPQDHFLLKHRYSAFDHTALDLLLDQLEIERLYLIGSAVEGCVVQTAIDARELGLKTTIVADACATTDPALESIALRYAERVVGARIVRSTVVAEP
jgi:nicotinamidase-related amidase